LPLSGAALGSTFLVDRRGDDLRIDADLRGITPKYFDVIGAPLLQGRDFTADDRLDTAPVAIVDETFARRLSPDGNVIGQRIRWFRQPDVLIEIVGVVRPIRHRGPGDPPRDTVYRPHRQYARLSMFMVIRTTARAARTAATVQAALRAVDPTQPIADVSTMDERLDRNISQVRTSFMLAGILAALALTLGVIGLYGVLSFDTAQRHREFGIRMSLGATPAAVRHIVVKEGLRLTLAGVGIGIVGAGWLASVMRTTVFATTPMDVRLYLLGSTLVVAASLVALWVPARRASTADPIAALRSE
jgi:predicted permease